MAFPSHADSTQHPSVATPTHKLPPNQAQADHLLCRVLCTRGAEDLIVTALQALPDVTDVQVAASGVGGVYFRGPLSTLYQANLALRCASRILVELANVPCSTADDLYAAAFGVPWEQFLDLRGTFAVSAHGSLPLLTNSMFVALRVKDALADRFVARLGERPSVDVHTPSLRVHVQLVYGAANQRGGPTSRVLLSLDSSYPALHERGYRQIAGAAPLKETLAGTIVEWSMQRLGILPGQPLLLPVVDLACGSGTLLIEAGLYLLGVPPGRVVKRPFGCQTWRGHQPPQFQQATARAEKQRRTIGDPFLFGQDLDPHAIHASRTNLDAAGLSAVSRLRVGDLRTADPPALSQREPPPEPLPTGIVYCNPPYGERLGAEDDIIALYRALGDTLKRRFTGYVAYIFTANLNAAKFIGLRPSARLPLYNGPLEGRLLEFRLR